MVFATKQKSSDIFIRNSDSDDIIFIQLNSWVQVLVSLHSVVRNRSARYIPLKAIRVLVPFW